MAGLNQRTNAIVLETGEIGGKRAGALDPCTSFYLFKKLYRGFSSRTVRLSIGACQQIPSIVDVQVNCATPPPPIREFR